MDSDVKPSRLFSIYREVGTPYEVAEARAKRICIQAGLILSRTVGSVGLLRVAGIEIPGDDNPLDISQVVIPGPVTHSVVVTQRLCPATDERLGAIGGTTYLYTLDGRIIGSQTMLSVPSPDEADDALSVAYGLHQFAHTYAAEHCQQPDCIMQPCETVSADVLKEVAAADQPFCFDHQYQLGVAAMADFFDNF